MSRFRLVIVAVAAMAIGALPVPTAVTNAASSVASAFSTTKIVTTSFSSDDYGVQTGEYKYAYCPSGYRVTGGGYDGSFASNTVRSSMAYKRADGRQAWRVRLHGVGGHVGATMSVQAVCITPARLRLAGVRSLARHSSAPSR